MSKNYKKPEMRFKEFKEEWEQRKLIDIANRYDNLRIPVTANDREFGDTPYYGANGIQDYVNGYTHKGEYVLVAEDGANDLKNYPVQYVNGEIWVNNHAHVLQGKRDLADNKFLKYVISQSNIEPLLVGGGRAKLNAEIMMNMDITLPKDINEQKKIGDIFQKIDSLVILQQRKIEKLDNIKKSLLDRMFPKHTEKVPKIRFKEFSDDWKQCELWELTVWDKQFNEVEKEKQPKVIKYPYVLADRFKDIEDNNGDVILLSTGTYVGYTTEEKAGKNLCEGEVVTIPWGGYPNIKYHKGKFVTADNRIATSRDRNVLDNKYLYYWMLNNVKYLETIYRGASIKHPSMNDILNMNIIFPSINEQKKICSVFESLDNLITKHQEKIEKLKEIKKACLNKMFV